MLCAEWWAFEVVALAAGWIGEKELAAQSIILTTSATAYMLPLGVSIAASTKIGNALGSGCPNRAKAGSRASLILALIVSSFNSIFFIAVKDVWGYLWVKDDEILVHIIATVLPLAALFQLNDGINGIGGGILRGCGHQKWGAVFNLSGYYLVGIPSGLAFAFSSLRLGLFGLWAGLTIALFLVSVCQLVWIYNIDWENEVDIAREKMRSMTSLIDEET